MSPYFSCVMTISVAKYRDMQTQVNELREEALAAIESAADADQLRELEITYLGRKQGKITAIMKQLGGLSAEQKPIIGPLANKAKQTVEAALKAKESELKDSEGSEWLDVTIPGKKPARGRGHPLSAFMRDIEEVFGRMGFSVAVGPEVDDEHHNFNALNIPPDHPAREMQDTFWVKNLEKHVLRTQTSNMQIHTMENGQPPFRLIAPGKVFRKDSDATHSPMFHQFEGLMIDKDISIGNLKWVLQTALTALFEREVEIRFRLSYFPFTEPSMEIDAKFVDKKGNQKWLELGGCGMTHPQVLRNVNLDPAEWNGFAFGFGVERCVMIKYGITDLRQFFNNDLRFLKQF